MTGIIINAAHLYCLLLRHTAKRNKEETVKDIQAKKGLKNYVLFRGLWILCSTVCNNKILNFFEKEKIFMPVKQLQHKSRSRVCSFPDIFTVMLHSTFTSWNFVIYVTSYTHIHNVYIVSETHIYAVSVECKKIYIIYIHCLIEFNVSDKNLFILRCVKWYRLEGNK